MKKIIAKSKISAAKAACAIPAVAVPIKHSASGKLSFTS